MLGKFATSFGIHHTLLLSYHFDCSSMLLCGDIQMVKINHSRTLHKHNDTLMTKQGKRRETLPGREQKY